MERRRLVLLLTLGLLVGPVVADLALSGPRRLFAWFAADAFYYLQVARNWADLGRISFDGEHPTNGFHPLWQGVEAALWWVGDAVGLGDTALLAVAAFAVLMRFHDKLTVLYVVLGCGIVGAALQLTVL